MTKTTSPPTTRLRRLAPADASAYRALMLNAYERDRRREGRSSTRVVGVPPELRCGRLGDRDGRISRSALSRRRRADL